MSLICEHPDMYFYFCLFVIFFYFQLWIPAFVTKLHLREDMLLENVNISPKSKGVENMSTQDTDSDIGLGPEFSTIEVSKGMI